MSFSRGASRSFAVAALLTLAGCASAPRVEPPAAVDIAQLANWEAGGRLGVSGPEGGGSGSFAWSQLGDHAQLEIRGPVGLGSVRIQMQGDGPNPELQLETANGQRLTADAAWAELEARLGAPVPAGQLRYWLRGLPAPGPHQWLKQSEAEAVLEQSGWRIEYQQFDTAAGPRLPKRMRASNGGCCVWNTFFSS